MEQINKYQNGKIYKIVSNVTDDVYIGSTCSTLSARLAQHRQDYKRYLNGTFHYITSFKILETNDYDIILLEDFKCKRKDQLHAQERFHIEGCDKCINKIIPTRTEREYEILRPNKKERNDMKKWKKLCECGSEYTLTHKARHEKTQKHQAFIQQQE